MRWVERAVLMSVSRSVGRCSGRGARGVVPAPTPVGPRHDLFVDVLYADACGTPQDEATPLTCVDARIDRTGDPCGRPRRRPGTDLGGSKTERNRTPPPVAEPVIRGGARHAVPHIRPTLR